MSAPQVREPEAPPPAWPMLRAMAGVGLVCGLLITTAYLATRPVIERKHAEALQRAVFDVLPGATASRSFAWDDEHGFSPLDDAAKSDVDVVHVGLDQAGRVVGVAIEATGMGYQDAIGLLYGYSPQHRAIVGLRVLESRETPGLGDRIETDPAFGANFDRLDVALAPDGSRVAHPIEAVKHGKKTTPWQIDGITGATISTQAVARVLRESTEVWVPRVEAHRARLEGDD